MFCSPQMQRVRSQTLLFFFFFQFFLPSCSVESNDGGQTRLLAQLGLRVAKPRERQGCTPSSYKATEGAQTLRQPQVLRLPLPWQRDGNRVPQIPIGRLIIKHFYTMRFIFTSDLQVSYHSKKSILEYMSSFVIRRFI